MNSVEYRRHPVHKDYFLSSEGGIFSLISNKFLSQAKGKDGYFRVCLALDGKAKSFLTHRLLAQTFLGDFVEEVNHKNLNKSDNRVCNLEHVTRSQNSRHAYMGKKRFVYEDKGKGRVKRFYIQIQVKGHPFISGGEYFSTKDEAYEFARDLYFKNFGEYPWN